MELAVNIGVILLFALQIALLVAVAMAGLGIKNGPVKSAMGRGMRLFGEGKRIAYTGKHAWNGIAGRGAAVAARVRGVGHALTWETPEGLKLTPNSLRKGLATAATLRGVAALAKREHASRKDKKTKRKPMLIERLGLVPPIVRPLLGLWRYRNIITGVLSGVKARR